MEKNRCAKKLGSGPSSPLLSIVSGCAPAGVFAELPCSAKADVFKNKKKKTFNAKDKCATFEVQTKQRSGDTIFEVTATSTTSNRTAISELSFKFSLMSKRKIQTNAQSVWGLRSARVSTKDSNYVFLGPSGSLLSKGQKKKFGFTLPNLPSVDYDFTITCKQKNDTSKGKKKTPTPIIMVVGNYEEKSFKQGMIYVFTQQKLTITETMIQVKVLPKKRQTSSDTTVSMTVDDPNGEAGDTFLALYNSGDPSIAASGLSIKSAAASADA